MQRISVTSESRQIKKLFLGTKMGLWDGQNGIGLQSENEWATIQSFKLALFDVNKMGSNFAIC